MCDMNSRCDWEYLFPSLHSVVDLWNGSTTLWRRGDSLVLSVLSNQVEVSMTRFVQETTVLV